MNNTLTLNDLKKGEWAKITGLPASVPVRRRIVSLGLTVNTEICVLYSAPFGDPRAYYYRGTVMALRRRDAGLIKAELL